MTPPTDPSYTAQALRTESPITPALQTRLQQQARLVHAVLGLQTEAGELADPVKKHIYYGRPLDLVNLREEIGDCLWYLAIAADALGTTLETEQARNLAKLRARYPHMFTAEAAQVRDLDREREVLEGNVADNPHTLRQQLAAARAEITTLQGASAADDQRLRDAEERIWPGMTWGCDAPDKMADEILHLRQWANKRNAELVKACDAAHVTILAQRAGIERLRACVGKVRRILPGDNPMSNKLLGIEAALKTLDAGTDHAPATEPAPCPECAKLRQQLDAAQSEIEAQRKAMADDSSRLRKAEERVWPGIGSACDPAKAMADEILGLREELAACVSETKKLQVERDKLHAKNKQQNDELSPLKQTEGGK